MKLYFWPYAHDEYFYSWQAFVIADSIEKAREIIKEKMDNEYSDGDNVLKSIFKNKPMIYELDKPVADFSETWR